MPDHPKPDLARLREEVERHDIRWLEKTYTIVGKDEARALLAAAEERDRLRELLGSRTDSVSTPGESLRDLLDERNLTQAWLARQFGVSRVRINHIVTGGQTISAVTALRLEALGLGSARFWLHRQADYDLFVARRGMNRKRGRPLTQPKPRRRARRGR